ncbi:MAG: radical SAM protein [Candidatus Electrothrix aestuarii]|uniref:Radical SAM protein n=1 Tax=Candidatus Electrothrix aestuarii TaxID=3062594 RepID=A0AAU8LR67_9BACT|nr:radical SAM protein [Candidatus Electrothrix aestuarii]
MLFPSAPLSYAVELTYACNNSCTGCANVWGTRRQQTLTNWRNLFDRIAPPEDPSKYAELIRLTGGEPTLHPELTQIVEHIDSLGIAHVLFTNGRWTDPASIIDLYQGQKNCLGMLVSLHGSTPAAHNTLVGDTNAFGQTCANIRLAADAGIEVFTNTILTKDSCEQVQEIIHLSQELGAEYAVFNRFLGGDNPYQPGKEQLRQAVLLIENLHRQGVSCRIGNCVPKCFAPNSTEGSNAGIEHCAISPEGLVRPDNLTSTVFGNIFEQPITEIWQSEQAQLYRQQIAPACLECVELSRCRGGDRSATLEQGEQQDPLMTGPIQEAEQKPIHLDPSWKPLARFRIREEPFGYLVTRYNWSVPVAYEAKPVLDAVNGEYTLAEIHERFGDEALELIGRLYQEDCLGFE